MRQLLFSCAFSFTVFWALAANPPDTSGTKQLRVILKVDLFAPLFSNFYVAAQLFPARKLSPEIGFGYMGNWNKEYTGLSMNKGYYIRLGFYALNSMPRKASRYVISKIYIRPELVWYNQHAVYTSPSWRYNTTTGFMDRTEVNDILNVNSYAFFLNFGRHLDFQKLTLDISIGLGITNQEVKHQRDPADGLGLIVDQYLPLRGAITTISVDPWQDAMQGGFRLGYKLF